MPESSSDPTDGRDKPTKRTLPSWMSSKEEAGSSSSKKKHADSNGDSTKGSRESDDSSSLEDNPMKLDFSKLLDGVVFALSGFVNPERGTLRSQALDMGAQYRSDWTSDCTLLVCAFINTPKFQQVESANGTIVSKEWISECHKQRKLVDIEQYLMHAGKPWRRKSKQVEPKQDKKNAPPKEHQKQVEKQQVTKVKSAAAAEGGGISDAIQDHFAPSKIKGWAMDDLKRTESWLESQEEKPEASELKAIAAEGIITCLQDAIESLEQGHHVKHVTEQWNFIPRVVSELAELDGRRMKGSLSKKELAQLAIKCKKIYQDEFDCLDSSAKKGRKIVNDNREEEDGMQVDDAQYDSDETIEMTEDEIDLAWSQLPAR